MTRSICLYRALRRNLVTTAWLLPLAAVAVPFAGKTGMSAFIATSLAVIAFAAAEAVVRAVCRERTVTLFARGGRSSAPYVERIAEELTSRSHCLGLANALAQTLWETQHLEEIPLATRPPPHVKHLRSVADQLETIISRLRTDTPASLHGVALCDRLITGGYGSSVYTLPVPELHQQLTRIRYLLDRNQSHESAAPPAREQ